MNPFLRFIDKRRFQRHPAILWAELRIGGKRLHGKLIDLSRSGFLFRPWEHTTFVQSREAVLTIAGHGLPCILLHRSGLGLHGGFATLLAQRTLEDLLRPPPPTPAAPATTDPYALLGVPRDATVEAIKAAYRAQVKRIHPDLQTQADAATVAALTERLARLNAAYRMVRGR